MMPEEDDNLQGSADEKGIPHASKYEGLDDSETSEPIDLPINNPDIPETAMQERLPSARRDHAPKSVIIRRLLILVVGILLIGAIGVIAWKVVPSKKDQTQTPATSSQNQPKQSEDQNSVAPTDNSLTETYSSDSLRLQFKYPGSWKVTEDNNGIIAKSSKIDFTVKDGSQTSGYFKIYIKRGATTTDGQYLGQGYAIAPSEKISYSEPATGQRKDTYLTNFGIDTPDNFAYFIVQGNFNLKKGDTLGPKFASEIDSYLIGGGFATDNEKDGLATQILTIDSYAQNGAYKTAVEIAKSLQLK